MSKSPAQKSRRTWKTRLIVIALGLTPLLLLEVVLQVSGYGEDRFSDYPPWDRVFVQSGRTVTLSPKHRMHLRTEPFLAEKAPGTHRIIVVGDSTPYGFTFPGNRDADGDMPILRHPFPSLLEARLRVNDPGSRWEVINCGACGCASTRLRWLTREIVRFGPDVVVFLAGTSEFLEQRMLAGQARSRRLGADALSGWKTLTLARDILRRLKSEPAPAQEARDDSPADATYSPFLPIMDEDVLASAGELDAILANADRNFEEIVAIVEEAGVPLVLCTVPANLRVAPQVSVRYRSAIAERLLEGIPQDVSARFAETFTRAITMVNEGRIEEARALLEPALETFRDDPRVVGLHYQYGRALDSLGDFPRARAHYLIAKDGDPFLWRVHSRVNETIRRLGARPDVILVDLERAFAEATPDGIPDQRLFYDRSHPLPGGHELIADQILAALGRAGLLGRTRTPR